MNSFKAFQYNYLRSPSHSLFTPPKFNTHIIKNLKLQWDNIPVRTKYIPPPGFVRKNWILWEGNKFGIFISDFNNI